MRLASYAKVHNYESQLDKKPLTQIKCATGNIQNTSSKYNLYRK